MIKRLVDIGKINLYKYVGIPKVTPKVINIFITFLCNSKCRTCNIWKIYQDDKQKLNQELKTEEIKRIIMNALNFDVHYISITGGDPFLRSDATEILSIIGNNFKVAGTVTNGLASDLIYDKTKKILETIPPSHFFTVAISLDGLEQKHDFQRGITGAFQKSIKTIRLLKELQKNYSNLNIDISFTLTNENYEDLKPTFTYLLDEKLISHPSHFSFRSAQQTKITNSPGDEKNKKEAIKSIRNLQDSYPYFKNKFVDGIVQYIRDPSMQMGSCYALYSSMWIDPYGDVFPCVGMMQEGPIGNIRQAQYDFKSVWFSDETNKKRVKIKKGMCPNCWVECQSIENMICSIYKPTNLEYIISRHINNKKFF